MTRDRDYPKFSKKERSTFRYWFWHWRAFNSVAVELGVWRPRHLFHDIEKPFLRLFLPYKKVQKFHRTHNRHHLEYPGKRNWTDMFVDWECSRFTKLNCPLAAFGEAKQKRKEGGISEEDFHEFMKNGKQIARNYRIKKAKKKWKRLDMNKVYSVITELF